MRGLIDRTSRIGPHGSGSGGFTLLEVLIALVVLSIGLLGIAALQGVGLRTSHGAHLSAQASLLAYDMADRMRANPETLATYDGFLTDTIDCALAAPTTPLATADLWEWACAVQSLLPGGSGSIAGVAVGGTTANRYTISIEWEDLQVEENADPWSYVLVVEI